MRARVYSGLATVVCSVYFLAHRARGYSGLATVVCRYSVYLLDRVWVVVVGSSVCPEDSPMFAGAFSFCYNLQ